LDYKEFPLLIILYYIYSIILSIQYSLWKLSSLDRNLVPTDNNLYLADYDYKKDLLFLHINNRNYFTDIIFLLLQLYKIYYKLELCSSYFITFILLFLQELLVFGF